MCVWGGGVGVCVELGSGGGRVEGSLVHYMGHLSSCSALWLNKTNQEVDSEQVSEWMGVYGGGEGVVGRLGGRANCVSGCVGEQLALSGTPVIMFCPVAE